MKPEQESNRLLGVTRSKAKMFEYSVPPEPDIDPSQHPSVLFTLAIGLLGDFAATINRGEAESVALLELKEHLRFSAHFFDSYRGAKLTEDLDPYLILMGSASYYLCDIPGSAMVLVKNADYQDLGGGGLDSLLLWLLKGDFTIYFNELGEQFGEFMIEISQKLAQFFQDGNGAENLISLAEQLRQAVYDFGTPRQLLLGDVIAAVLVKKLENSTWKALRLYSGLSIEQWRPALQKPKFIKELWPAQHFLGQAGVLAGQSAIIQMPTSAGKTKAIELIVRSAFLSGRASLAIIVAPFRALCAEIKDSLIKEFDSEPIVMDELFNISRIDPAIFEDIGQSYVAVVTPERLISILRHNGELAARVGLLVFDEGHQFDNGTRGITYELLLTSLNFMVASNTQKVLISAVISNAEAIGEWLNGEANVVNGTALIPTLRSVGFASWPADAPGLMEYVNEQNIEQGVFPVPSVIQSVNLGTKGRETKDRIFPDRNDKSPQVSQAIALYLGLKLVRNGGVAIFCGKKNTATNLCEKAVDIIGRGWNGDLPLTYSDSQEVTRLQCLLAMNLGNSAPVAQSAVHGIFAHHGSTPRGIRLAVEYAMRENLIKFVICTNTLGQGVNLPIKYLIVTGVQQNQETIKTRDFQNLMGRAGRADKHTEGSILFADHAVYDMREDPKEGKRWTTIKELLDPNKSEKSTSNLLSIFNPIKSRYENAVPIPIDLLDFVTNYINDPNSANSLINNIVASRRQDGFILDYVTNQINGKINIISEVESFLLSHWEESLDVVSLAENTLAFFLASDTEKEYIRALFKLLAENIATNIPDPAQRKIYGKMFRGIHDAKAIRQWVETNLDNLLTFNESDTLSLVWSLFTENITEKVFTDFDKPEVCKETAREWIEGKSFGDLLGIINAHEAKKKAGSQLRNFNIEDVVKLCEGTFSYHGTMLIGAVCEIIEMLGREDTAELLNHLRRFQKHLKHGLPTETMITLYELGFSDRVICQDLATSLPITISEKRAIVAHLKLTREAATNALDKYPAYFQNKLEELLHS